MRTAWVARARERKAMDWLLYHDALSVLYVQKVFYRLPYMESLAVYVTKLGDPRYAYVIAFPVIFWTLGPVAGYHVILAASAAEWCNIVLKWLLLGNRPYWWAWFHTDWPHLLHQTPVTCETGPGNPSGHVMITLVVLLTALHYVERRRRRLEVVSWLAVCLIGLSRLLISSHFIHQIVCGLLFGSLIHSSMTHPLSVLLSSSPHSRFRHTLGLGLLMIVLALFLLHMWTTLGMDPGFSIPLAKRFCAEGQWVKLNTSPLFSLMRSAGSVVGVAFATALRPPYLQPGTIRCLVGLFISTILIGCLETVPVATELSAFYVQSFCMCAMIPVAVGIVHFIINR